MRASALRAHRVAVVRATQISEDLEDIKDLFRADGEGLSDQTIEALATDIGSVVSLMAAPTDMLVDMYDWKSIASGKDGNGVGSRVSTGGSDGATGQSSVGPQVAVRVLCHRSDRDASKFLKKRFAMQKADGKTGRMLLGGKVRAKGKEVESDLQIQY